MNFEKFLVDFKNVQDSHKSFVVVTLVHSRGSVPHEIGARLIVTEQGYYSGTVGGGKIEKAAIEKSQTCLRDEVRGTQFCEWNLQADLGMSCGGVVCLFFEIYNLKKDWSIVIFGAGHVAQELIRLLLRLECRIHCIDSRIDWLERLPIDEKLAKHCLPKMADYVPLLQPEDFVGVMTMGHGTDLPILTELLKTKQVAYLGVIGSDVKALRLRKNLVDAGVSPGDAQKFYCPMGEDFGTNTPAEIALSIACQMVRCRDLYRSQMTLTKT